MTDKDPRKIVTEWWQPKADYMDKSGKAAEQKTFAPKSSYMDKTPPTTPQEPASKSPPEPKNDK